MKSNIIVMKFGGTSVKSIARIQHVAEIAAEASKQRPALVVVSAMGDTTDYLLKLAKQCTAMPDKRELDLLLSTGEQISISLLAITLRNMSIAARSFTGQQIGIFTENVHNKARIVDIKKDTLEAAFKEHSIVVVAGFQGITSAGDVTTLGRGGSDTTAVALAAAVGAQVCDIYTDVDGIYTADPNVIKNARLLEQISYGEVLEMAAMGAQVIHPRAVELARQYNIILRVRNTFKPDHEGTTIRSAAAPTATDKGTSAGSGTSASTSTDRGTGASTGTAVSNGRGAQNSDLPKLKYPGDDNMELFRTVSGVAIDKDQACVAIVDVPDQPGIAAKVTQALADENIVIDMIMQSFHPTIGLNNISFTINDADLDQTIATLQKIKAELGAKEVVADPDIAKVSIIGSGLSGQPKVPAKLFAVLGKAKINIKMISSSEMKITCVLSRHDANRAAQLIHDAFELGLTVQTHASKS